MTPSELAALGDKLRTQDNACTAEPLFVVYEAERIYGLDPDYVSDQCWLRPSEQDGGEETDPDLIAQLDALRDAGEDSIIDGSEFTLTGYVDRDRFVTLCFTRDGAEDFIVRNKHRHKGALRIDVDSAYRNPELKAIRRHLMEQGQ